jgi:hypothetical protein
MRYRVIVENLDGLLVYDNHHSEKVLYSWVLLDYSNRQSPLLMEDDHVNVWAFSLETAVESYLNTYLPDGDYLVHIPVSEKARKNFWRNKATEQDLLDHRVDCVVTQITDYDKPAIYLASKSNPHQPGRYLLVTVRRGFVQSTVSLI